MQRILLIQLKRIGDFILTVPALAALRAARPDAELVLMVPSAVAGLARGLTQVDRIIDFKAGSPNLEAWGSAVAGEWEACLDFTGTDRSALLTKLSRATHRLGYLKFAGPVRRMAYTHLSEASVRELHTVDFHLALVNELIGEAALEEPAPVVRIPKDVSQSAQKKLKATGVTGTYAIVHAGTAREEKFWLDDRWAEVIAHIQGELKLPVVLTGTGTGLEEPHLMQLKAALQVPVADLTGQLTLDELASLIAECALIVGVDSMAMHLAAIFKKPQVALFGPTNPYHWRARHDKAVVLQGEKGEPVTQFVTKTKRHGMNQISTNAVIHAIASVHSR